MRLLQCVLALILSVSVVSGTTDPRIRGMTGVIGPKQEPTPVLGHHSHFELNRKHFSQDNYHEHFVSMSNGKTFALHYHTVGNVNITMGDIVVPQRTIDLVRRAEAAIETSSTGLLEFDEERLEESHPLAVEIMGVAANGIDLWECPIPFVIPTGMPNPERVTEAIQILEDFTNWRFVTRTNEEDYISFEFNTGNCASAVGKNIQNDAHFIQLGPECSVGAAVHEFLHALGMLHEHTRRDRDQYVQILTQNIDNNQQILQNFEVFDQQVLLTNEYDFESIMHYGSTDFSADMMSQTISIRSEFVDDVCLIGQRYEMSPLDAQSAQQLYNNAASYGAECPETATLPEYPECDPNTEIRICGRQGSNDFINGKYQLMSSTFAGRPVYQREDLSMPLFVYYQAEDAQDDDGEWRISSEVGSNQIFAVASPTDGNSLGEADDWQVCCNAATPPEFVREPRMFVAACDFSEIAAASRSFSLSAVLLIALAGFVASRFN